MPKNSVNMIKQQQPRSSSFNLSLKAALEKRKVTSFCGSITKNPPTSWGTFP